MSITGYRELTDEETQFINSIKNMENNVAQMCTALDGFARSSGNPNAGRWASLARTHLETGFMFAVKTVSRPFGGLGAKAVSAGAAADPVANSQRPSSEGRNEPEPAGGPSSLANENISRR